MSSLVRVKEEPVEVVEVKMSPATMRADPQYAVMQYKQEPADTQIAPSSSDMSFPVRVKEEPAEPAAFEIEILPTMLNVDPQCGMMPCKQEPSDTQPAISGLQTYSQDVTQGALRDKEVKKEINIVPVTLQPSHRYTTTPENPAVREAKESEFKATKLKQVGRPRNVDKPGETNDVLGEEGVNSKKSVTQSQKRFECSQCHKILASAGSLSNHMFLHTGKKPYQCSECDKSFSFSCKLRSHMLTHSGEKPFKCLECKKGFSKSNNLKIHMLMHTGEKPFQCTQCDKSYSIPSRLRTHMITHCDENPFECVECHKYFTNRYTLKAHMSVHSGEKPFQCLECKKCFSQLGHLKTHMTTHSGEKPLECTVCHKFFSCLQNLKNHLLSHSGENSVKCVERNKEFPQSSNLKPIYTPKKSISSLQS